METFTLGEIPENISGKNQFNDTSLELRFSKN